MKYKISLNGIVYEVEVEKGEAQLLNEYEAIFAPATSQTPTPTEMTPAKTSSVSASAASIAPASGGIIIPSPLPGTVVAIKVSVGQKISAGDVVAVVEAMKMENEISSPVSGTVVAILTSKGAQIQADEPLVQIAEAAV